jgi:hypothetical protein
MNHPPILSARVALAALLAASGLNACHRDSDKDKNQDKVFWVPGHGVFDLRVDTVRVRIPAYCAEVGSVTSTGRHKRVEHCCLDGCMTLATLTVARGEEPDLVVQQFYANEPPPGPTSGES